MRPEEAEESALTEAERLLRAALTGASERRMPTATRVLLCGASGSGKTHLARSATRAATGTPPVRLAPWDLSIAGTTPKQALRRLLLNLRRSRHAVLLVESIDSLTPAHSTAALPAKPRGPITVEARGGLRFEVPRRQER